MNQLSVARFEDRFLHFWAETAQGYTTVVLEYLNRTSGRRYGNQSIATRFRPYLEDLEGRIVPSYADGNGAVVTNLAEQNNGAQLVISFDGPLDSAPANPVQRPTNVGNYSVQVPAANAEVITSSTSSVAISSATYNSSTYQVTLNLASPLTQGSFYRVFINGVANADGTANPGLIDGKGNAIDGDYDDTASGNFYALFGWTTAGKSLNFSDSGGDQVTLTISGPGQLVTWRALDGDFTATDLALQAGLAMGAVQQLTVDNGVLGQTTLSGSATFATGNSVVVVPSIAGQGITFTNALPAYFQLTAAPLPTPPTPVAATSTNLPYTLQIQQVTSTLPDVQSPVAAQDNVAGSPFDGYWLLFGGRTNGLHNFNANNDFPPQQQNEDIFVVNPATWQSWTLSWSSTDVPTTMTPSLYSTNQESYQQGDTLYTVGGYGAPDQGGGTFGAYTTYDTLTALSVNGLITAVVNGGSARTLSQIQQIQDPRLQVTGGEMQLIGNEAYLVVGQDFQGDYFSPTATQTYTDEVQSFLINYNGQVAGSLGITNYQAQNDQVNFRRRDYDLGNVIQTGLQPGLEIFGGVFTPGAQTDPSNGQGYRNPIVVSGIGATQVGQYQQFFNQYSSPNIGLYDASNQSMFTIFVGGISLYDYNFSTGQLTEDTELPFVDDVTTLVQGANGVDQEYEMPSQLPGFYGAEARFFQTPGLPQYSNGVIQLDDLSQPTTLGYMFGGILSTVPNTTDPATQTSATNALFRIVLVPAAKPPPKPTTYTVTSLADSNTGSGDSGTLRYVLNLANANHTGTASAPDQIDFATAAGTIHVGSQSNGAAVPALASNEVAMIDATTATGYNGSPVITLDGTSATAVTPTNGLTINGSSSTIKGFDIVHFSGNGIDLHAGGSNTVIANDIGITTAGTVAANGEDGISVDSGSKNTIGGTAPGDRNVISGNLGNGIYLSATTSNRILGNYIGTDPTGTLNRGNGANGVEVTGSSVNNVIGGIPGNVISGNTDNGVLLTGGSTLSTVNGNTIGLTVSGNAALGNGQDGVQIQNSTRNIIGQTNPVTGVTYYSSNNVTMPVNAWQGIRAGDASGQYLISGTAGSNGLLFEGTMAGTGTSYAVNYPNALNTSVYGPDNLGGGNVALVGSYKNYDYATAPVTINGFLFEGTTADLSDSSDYQTIDYPGADYNFVHSVMGGLAVGNYDSTAEHGQGGLPLGPGHAFLYDVASKTFLTDIDYPGSTSNTAYGIWYNGGTSYTICGGYSDDTANNFANQNEPFGQAYLVDYDSATGKFSHWASYTYPSGTNYITHFESISSVEKGVYTLAADSLQSGSSNPVQGSLVTIRRSTSGSFGGATWVNLHYPNVAGGTVSANSVYGNQMVGIVLSGTGVFPYQATVNVGFQLSNVISANGGNGINLSGANGNQIAMNYIGTNAAGTAALGNAQNGILITDQSTNNMIGGEATGGNDPTNGVFVRPPEGNLISGNAGAGVLINAGATANILGGNFIGTDASGDAALGNALDGVDIESANGNSLIGCTFQQDPFVFYNVISGNGGNGLTVNNSNNTTIQANFFGMGANNDTALGNLQNGVVVEGTSSNTTMGGPIPLGNVDAANDQNGLVVRDTASNFVTYNTFTGLPAFSTAVTFGNKQDGMLITSTGANILIRTCVIDCNGNDGIEIGGAAQGVRVTGNEIGLDSNGNLAMGNRGNGLEIDGTAHNILIGGPAPTFNVIPHNAMAASGGNGIAVDGNAYNVTINSSFIGTDLLGTTAIGNTQAGVLVGPGTHSVTIGSTNPTFLTVISGNVGDGVEMRGTTGNTVVGCLIGTDALGSLPVANGGDGIYLSNSSNNLIGRSAGPASTSPANVIADNTGDGVDVASGNSNGIRQNSIYGNTGLGINLGPWANDNQAAPLLTSAQTLGAGIHVTGTVDGTANTIFTIDFFADTTSSAAGRYLLGTTTAKSNPAGLAAFLFNGPLPPSGGDFITATATDPVNNTSEFSAPASLT